jgi:uncharacterized protein YcaQ
MPKTIRRVDAPTARRFLVRRHLLAPARSVAPGTDGILQVFARLGSIQFDPLSVAGRNHDLVLHARVRDYDPSWTEALLYDRRALYETYNKGLSLVPSTELPWFRVTWDLNEAEHRTGVFARHGDTVTHVLERIRAEGPLSSLDFDRRAAIDWYWGPTSEVRAVLEALSEAGILGLARRDGNRRFYDLVERLFPAELLAHRIGFRDQRRHKLLSRYRGGGLLGTSGQAELWLGLGKARRTTSVPPDVPVREELHADLVASGELVEVEVEGVRGRRYIVATELPMLDAAERLTSLPGTPSAAFLAPLDPIVWDRDLLRQLFGFDYRWEVYVPEARRRWGYYVLPLLYGDRFVGRIEPRIGRRTGTVRILGAWWEAGFDPRTADGFVDGMRDALGDYLRFARAREIEWAPGLNRERKLFSARPRTRAAGSPAGGEQPAAPRATPREPSGATSAGASRAAAT